MFQINATVSCFGFFAANVKGMKEKTRTVVSKKIGNYIRVRTRHNKTNPIGNIYPQLKYIFPRINKEVHIPNKKIRQS
jgi:hypothetical protein